MDRREFLKGTAAAGAAAVLPFSILPEKEEPKIPDKPFVENGHWVKPRAAEALKKWSKHFDFSVVEKAYAPELALMIDNQDIINSIQVPHANKTHEIDLQFVFDVYSSFVGRHLVSVQAMDGPTDVAKHKRLRYNPADDALSLYIDSEPLVAKSSIIKTYYHPDDALFVANDLTRDIVRDLRNNAGRKGQCIEDDLLSSVLNSSNIIHRKTLMGGANWILTSPEMWGLLQRQYPCVCEERKGTSSEIHKAGRLVGSRFIVYVDPLYVSRELLIGRRLSGLNDCVLWNYDAGYLYCPYIPFNRRHSIEGYRTNRMFTRYGRMMVDNNYYALLTVI